MSRSNEEIDPNFRLNPEEIANPFMSPETIAEMYEKTKEVIKVNINEGVENISLVEIANPLMLPETVDNPLMFLETVEEEIALWEFCSPDELYTLLKDDPSRYLPFLEKNKELAQKHRCLVTRDNNRLRIKYRIFPEDRWTECGYFTDFDDQIIYQEFSDSVQRTLNIPRNRKDPKKMSQTEYIKQLENTDRSHITTEINQKMVNASDGALKVTRPLNTDIDMKSVLECKSQQMQSEGFITEKVVPKRTQLDESSYTNFNSVNNLLDAYLQQILERMNASVPIWLAGTNSNEESRVYTNKGLDQLIMNLKSVEQRVPKHLSKEFQELIMNLKTSYMNDFYGFMFEQKQHFLPRYLEPIYDNFLVKLICGSSLYLSEEWTHSKICLFLNLSTIDLQLMEEHNIDLRELWNNYNHSFDVK